MLSIVIPFFNEETMLGKYQARYADLSLHAEMIFVDGQSTDNGALFIQHIGQTIVAPKGRAVQMNRGASQAKGDILFFLHADNMIDAGLIAKIEAVCADPEVIGGCLTQKIDHASSIYRIIEAQGNMRARLRKIFYGDQGIFVRKDVFLKVGGFPNVPIMEDVLFTKKLRAAGRTVVLPDLIHVSARRWEKEGILRMMLLYQWILLLYAVGVPLQKIQAYYEERR